MRNTVKTKRLKNGDRLVVVNIDGKFEYAPKYIDLKRLIMHLGAIYGKKEVTRELGLGKTTAFPTKKKKQYGGQCNQGYSKSYEEGYNEGRLIGYEEGLEVNCEDVIKLLKMSKVDKVWKKK